MAHENLCNPTIKPEAMTPSPTPKRYQWQWKGATFDFYRLCEILGITHHAQAHALKKVIRAGRSIKPLTQDIDEAINALERWREMLAEDASPDYQASIPSPEAGLHDS